MGLGGGGTFNLAICRIRSVPRYSHHAHSHPAANLPFSRPRRVASRRRCLICHDARRRCDTSRRPSVRLQDTSEGRFKPWRRWSIPHACGCAPSSYMAGPCLRCVLSACVRWKLPSGCCSVVVGWSGKSEPITPSAQEAGVFLLLLLLLLFTK